MIAPAKAKNGNPAQMARTSTSAFLHFCFLVLIKLPATPPQFGDPLPFCSDSSGWLYRISLVVEYSNRFFGVAGKRFWDSDFPLRCPFGGGLPGSGGGLLEVTGETILAVALWISIIGISSMIGISSNTGGSSSVLLTAPSRDPPRTSILCSQRRGLPCRHTYKKSKKISDRLFLDSGVHDVWVNALQACINIKLRTLCACCVRAKRWKDEELG
jgi:hypothetical protein